MSGAGEKTRDRVIAMKIEEGWMLAALKQVDNGKPGSGSLSFLLKLSVIVSNPVSSTVLSIAYFLLHILKYIQFFLRNDNDTTHYHGQ